MGIMTYDVDVDAMARDEYRYDEVTQPENHRYWDERCWIAHHCA